MIKQHRGEYMVSAPHKGGVKMPIDAAFHEVTHNTPKSVIASGKTGKAKRKMEVAIALSKAGKSKK